MEDERDMSSVKFTAIYRQVSSDSLLSVPAGICKRAVVDKSG
jgi:hypothetical protein